MTNTLIKILNIACHIDCPHRHSPRGSWRAKQSDKRELPSNEYIHRRATVLGYNDNLSTITT